MRKLKMIACALTLPLVLAACASRQPTLQPVSSPQAEVPEAAAWAMQYKSTSRQKLEALFSISENRSEKTAP
ncbi:Rz-like spanin [Serratia phage Parlo]|uniref:O-spanin n=1 Tax=Serratia phage Parlo TaxID=2557554 RepID=A0A482MH38_9CAUD|nr:Rz-like spanin [Serratia phage Parlo]QBQ72236.1 o-spanin [Serratia phage Parlo]